MKNENDKTDAYLRKLKYWVQGMGLATIIGIEIAGRALSPPDFNVAEQRAHAFVLMYNGGNVQHYVQRDGSHTYLATTNDGKKLITTDRDNNGVPEHEIVLGSQGGGWIDEYSNTREGLVGLYLPPVRTNDF